MRVTENLTAGAAKADSDAVVSRQHIEKPWGVEEVWDAGRYVVKCLHLRPGHRLSRQYHRQKTETLMVHRGQVRIALGDAERIYRPGEVVHVPAGKVHRIAAVDGPAVLFEASTPELDDVVRVEDDYGRVAG